MTTSILIAYASVSSSTAEIATAMAEELRRHNFSVDILPMRKVTSLEGYQAVILGTALYMFRWHGDTTAFLRRFRKPIEAGLPVAFFAGGPFHDTEKEWSDVRANVDKLLAKYPWFHPASVQIVGGRFEPSLLGFPYKLFPPMKQMPPSDVRNWEAIRTWVIETAAAMLKA